MIDHRSYIHNLSSCEIKAWTGSNPWPLRYRCSALPTELSSHLRASHFVSSWYTRRRWKMQMNIWKNIYSNFGETNQLLIDHRSCTHNLSSCEKKGMGSITFRLSQLLKVPMKWKIIAAYLTGFSKKIMTFYFLKYLFSF